MKIGNFKLNWISNICWICIFILSACKLHDKPPIGQITPTSLPTTITPTAQEIVRTISPINLASHSSYDEWQCRPMVKYQSIGRENIDQLEIIGELKNEYLQKIVGLAFSPDNNVLITVSRENILRFWCLSNSQLLKTIEGEEHIYLVEFSPNQELWAVKTNASLYVRSTLDGTLQLQTVCDDFSFSADWTRLATSFGNMIRIWDTNTGVLIREITSSEPSSITLSPDGKILIAGSCIYDPGCLDCGCDEGELQSWTVADGKHQWSVKQPTNFAAFSPDGLNVVVSHGDLFVYGAVDGKWVKKIENPVGYAGKILFSLDGRVGLVPRLDVVRRIVVVDSGELFLDLMIIDTENMARLEPSGSSHLVDSFSLSQDGTILAVTMRPILNNTDNGTNDGVIYLWGIR